MGWFGRSKGRAPRISDPVFGIITRGSGWWEGEVTFPPTRSSVDVALEADEQGPTSAQRSLYEGLVERFAGLQPTIGQALWELFQPWREEFWDAGKSPAAPKSAGEMLESTGLECIEIRKDGSITLRYAFDKAVGWDDASFRIRVENWAVRAAAVDD